MLECGAGFCEPEISTRRPLKRIEQAGGIVIRSDGDGLAVLLVRAKKDPALWIFPKGHIEPGETAEATALRETHEEAGLTGEVLGPVGEPLEFQSGHELVRVQYFLIRPIAETASIEGREKRWLAFDEARRTLAFENARRLLDEISLTLDEISGFRFKISD
jgi:8-oxo-dGTP pyrophosphatase MutT (NUDIX family)